MSDAALVASVMNELEGDLFTRHLDPKDVAAIFVEPIQGEGGYLFPPDGFMKALRELCDKHGILLVADEIQCGVGSHGAHVGLRAGRRSSPTSCSPRRALAPACRSARSSRKENDRRLEGWGARFHVRWQPGVLRRGDCDARPGGRRLDGERRASWVIA